MERYGVKRGSIACLDSRTAYLLSHSANPALDGETSRGRKKKKRNRKED
jgi:hypothetical protein